MPYYLLNAGCQSSYCAGKPIPGCQDVFQIVDIPTVTQCQCVKRINEFNCTQPVCAIPSSCIAGSLVTNPAPGVIVAAGAFTNIPTTPIYEITDETPYRYCFVLMLDGCCECCRTYVELAVQGGQSLVWWGWQTFSTSQPFPDGPGGCQTVCRVLSASPGPFGSIRIFAYGPPSTGPVLQGGLSCDQQLICLNPCPDGSCGCESGSPAPPCYLNRLGCTVVAHYQIIRYPL